MKSKVTIADQIAFIEDEVLAWPAHHAYAVPDGAWLRAGAAREGEVLEAILDTLRQVAAADAVDPQKEKITPQKEKITPQEGVAAILKIGNGSVIAMATDFGTEKLPGYSLQMSQSIRAKKRLTEKAAKFYGDRYDGFRESHETAFNEFGHQLYIISIVGYGDD